VSLGAGVAVVSRETWKFLIKSSCKGAQTRSFAVAINNLFSSERFEDDLLRRFAFFAAPYFEAARESWGLAGSGGFPREKSRNEEIKNTVLRIRFQAQW